VSRNADQDRRVLQRFNNFKKALKLYQEAVFENMSRLEEEGMIHRFEYTFELAWKCLQDLLQERGYANARGPRPVLEQAFQDGIISNGPLWMQMLNARNESTHLYDEAIFTSICAIVKGPFLAQLQTFESHFPI
jgi:nucleotidyltransferase substrate binding protein (TIGR01987 family)